jgi:hypothetical protein
MGVSAVAVDIIVNNVPITLVVKAANTQTCIFKI